LAKCNQLTSLPFIGLNYTIKCCYKCTLSFVE